LISPTMTNRPSRRRLVAHPNAGHILMIDRISLTTVLRELAELTGERMPTYRRTWGLTVSGRLPAELINGRWFFTRADLPAIAVALGLTVPIPVPRPILATCVALKRARPTPAPAPA
jgi:hypothetical protein